MIISMKLSNAIRKNVLRMCHLGGSSHVASCLSMADIVACTYSNMKKRSAEPHWSERDYFILSKGHAGATIYAALAELGYFEVRRLEKHYQNGSTMSGHVSHVDNPGVEFSTGSLGHGLPVCGGIAKSFKLDNRTNKVYCIISDGELGEGSNWEAILFSAHHKLDNLTVLVDRNRLQSLKDTEETLALEPLGDKLIAFGWNVISVDGHNHSEITDAIISPSDGKPKFIICNTTKGKGVSFMENEVLWHYKSPNEQELTMALSEL